MRRLIPLSEIPYRARDAERDARAAHPTRADALRAAPWAIVDAEGTYDGPSDRTTYGYVVTQIAAEAMGDVRANPPGGNHARHLQLGARMTPDERELALVRFRRIGADAAARERAAGRLPRTDADLVAVDTDALCDLVEGGDTWAEAIGLGGNAVVDLARAAARAGFDAEVRRAWVDDADA